MALKVRLARLGAKKKPYYRVVVADSAAKRDGRFLEIVGFYDPNKKPANVEIKQELLDKWLSRGAKPTETVASLIKNNKG
ncbi:MAG: 30S ribosomal protein S16 [Deltaproteobacteria bacterium]|jgi:small subunit ribosomal protein S16|nr:30S ribosomal protein S16 [Deltaproteobacteria bacterium]MDR1296752.1 30S ribosomal protein S16 [Deltaproteobacteria bacterium]